MGQSNQTENKSQQPGGLCCLSRRYIVHKNQQKQNKRNQKNQKQLFSQYNELQIQSKEIFREPGLSKTFQKRNSTNENQNKIGSQNKLKDKALKLQQVVNLGLQSQVAAETDSKQKGLHQINFQKVIQGLPDISEQIQKNSTRQNSIASNNLSNKNSIKSNHQKLKNKIKNIKKKYCANQEQLSIQNYQQKAPQKEKQCPKQRKQAQKQLKHAIQKSNLPEQNQKQSQTIEFFSQHSQSDDSSEQNKSNQKQLNQEMLNSRKIQLMVRQLKSKQKKVHQPVLQRIPEESQKIHSSKSEDEVVEPIRVIQKNQKINLSPKNYSPQKALQQRTEQTNHNRKKQLKQRQSQIPYRISEQSHSSRRQNHAQSFKTEKKQRQQLQLSQQKQDNNKKMAQNKHKIEKTTQQKIKKPVKKIAVF